METVQEILKAYVPPPEMPAGRGDFCGVLEPGPKAVLFDVYGTLVRPRIGDLEDRRAALCGPESFEETARHFGMDPKQGRVWQERFFAEIQAEHEAAKKKGIIQAEVLAERIWQKMLSRSGLCVSLEEARSFALYRELQANPVAAFQGAAPCLKKLKKAGYRLGLASNSQFYTLLILEKVLGLEVNGIFEREVCTLSFELGFAKPDPHFFRVAKTKLAMQNLEPQDVVMVGNDWENDVAGSRAEGFRRLFFRGEESGAKIPEGKGIAEEPAVYDYRDIERALRVSKE